MYHGGSKKKPEKWDYASLEWIHRARVDIYRTERKRALTEIAPRLSPNAAALARRLKLKTIRDGIPGDSILQLRVRFVKLGPAGVPPPLRAQVEEHSG